MNYGYIRVSSDKQTVENQRFEIINFCEKKEVSIDGWIEETISGTKSYNKRALGRLLKRVKNGDLIICAEISRLGRNLFMIMEILNICMNKGCKVWSIKDGYRLGEDIQSKVREQKRHFTERKQRVLSWADVKAAKIKHLTKSVLTTKKR